MSALIADGPPSRLLEAAIDGRIELLLPGVVLDELRRVLIEKLGFDDDHVDRAQGLFERIASPLPRPRSATSVTGDPSDDEILACAVRARADVLVTGDGKHLLPLGEHGGVRLLTPQALLAELRIGAA